MKRSIKILSATIMFWGLNAITAFPQDAQGTLIWENGYETIKGLIAWPNGSQIVLDTENKKNGNSSILFTADNNCTVYAYLPMKSNYKYHISLWYKADKTPISRNGILCNFNKKGEGNGSAGNKLLPFENINADKQWHEFSADFVSLPETAVCQFQTCFYRTNASVNIDDIKLYELGSASKEELQVVSGSKEGDTTKGSEVQPFTNGDFEDKSSGWSPWFKPEEASFAIDTNEKHSGTASLLISGDAPGRHFLARKVAVTPGSTYKVSFWVKTSEANENCAVACDFFPVNTKPRPYVGLEKMRGSRPWTQYSFYAEAPAGAKGAYLCLIHGSGKIWFDDIEFTEEQ